MAQEYLVTQFKKGDFQDAHGNFWCDMALQGIGEPVRIVVKDPMKYEDGMKLYGEVKEMTSQAGKTYNRFYREQRPEGHGQTTLTNDKPSEEYWEDKNSAIKAQWAINQSREYIQHQLGDQAKLAEILETAKLFYGMVDVVKAPEASQQTGYDKFKASKPTPQVDKDEDEAETASLVAKMEETMNEPIDMSEIPF